MLLSYGSFGLLQVSGSRNVAVGRKATSHVGVLLLILVADWGFGLYEDQVHDVGSPTGRQRSAFSTSCRSLMASHP